MKVNLFLILLLIFTVQPVFAEDDAPEPESTQEQVIEPDIYRRDIVVPRIDTENFEVLDVYGPRPSIATKLVDDYKNEHGVLTPEFKEDLLITK